MAEARISIGINADVGNALSGLQKLSAAIGSTVSAIDKLTPSANQAGSNLNKAFSGIGSIDTSKFTSAQGVISSSVDKMVSDAGRSGAAFSALSGQLQAFGGGVFVSTLKEIPNLFNQVSASANNASQSVENFNNSTTGVSFSIPETNISGPFVFHKEKIKAAINEIIAGLGKSGASFTNLKSVVSGFGGGVASFTSSFKGIGTASVSAIKSLDELEAEISQLQTILNRSTDVTQIKRLGAEIDRLRTQANNLKVVGLEKSLDKITSSAGRTAGRVRELAKASNQAGPAVISLTRIVQDAPFGLIGVGNNITELIPQFQRLKAETKSTGAAFKALGLSLLGPAGIGFALSAVISALTYFSLKNRSAKDDTDELAKSTNAAADREKEFKEAVDKAAASVVGQAKELKDLRDILIQTSGEIKNLTTATINQGLAQLIFDKKNVEVQKILSAEIEKQLKLRKQSDIRANVPEFDLKSISNNPLDRQIGQANEALSVLNAQGKGLEAFFELFLDGKKKVKDSSDELKKLAKAIQDVLITPEPIIFKEFDTDKEALNKAKATISGFLDGTIFKIKLQPVVSLSEPDIGGSLDLSFLQKQLVDIETKLKVTTDSAEFDRLTVAADLVRQQISSILSELTRDVLKTYDKLIDGSDKSFRTGAILGQQFVDGFTEAAESSTGTGLLTAFQADILTKEFEKEFAKFGKNLPKIDIGKSLFANREDLSKQLKDVAQSFQLAQFAANTASQAFGSAFDALFEGENVADAVANSFKALIKDIAKAIIQTLIFKAVTGLFGFGGGISGGGAGSGVLSGLFGTAGLGGLSTPGGQTSRLAPGLIPVQVSGQFVQRGNVMVATISQTQISQGRNG